MDLKTIQEKLEIVVSNSLNIGEVLVSLDNLLVNKEFILNKRLAHYLERRSYEKALKFIKGEVVEG